MYRSKARKTVAFFLCVIFLLSSAGCQRENSSAPETDSEVPAEGFSLAYMPLPDELVLYTALFAEENAVYIGGFSPAGAAAFGKYADGSFKKYELPEDISYIYACCSVGDKAIALAGDYPQFWTDVNGNRHLNDDPGKSISIIVYGLNGEISSQIPINDERVLEQNVKSIRYYNDKFYLLAQYSFAQIDLSGNVSNILQTENSTFISQELTGEGIALCYYDAAADGGDNMAKLASVDALTFQLSDIYADDERFFNGLGYTSDGKYLINADGVLLETDMGGSISELFSFSEIGSAKLNFTEIFEFEGDYLAVARNQTYITKITYGELNDTRQELRLLAVVNSPAITGLVERFNRSSLDYVVKIEYIGDMSQEQLNAAAATGNGPDIYAMIGTDVFENVRHDAMFENLYPYLLNDADYGTETLIPALLDTVMENGALYNIPIDFMVWTFCAQKDRLPQGGIDFAALAGEYAAPIFSSSLSQSDLWYWISNLYLNNYLDEQKMSVDFETEEFISLLECCDKVDKLQIPSDDFGIIHLEQLSTVLRLEYLHNRYGENYSLNAGIGSAFSIQQSLAISSLSKNKDGVWQFVRAALSPNFPQSADLCLPATQKRFDALLAQGLNGSLWNLTEAIQISDYDVQELRELVDSTRVLLDEYPDIIQIMKEEAAKFFAGDKTAAQTAEAIQSRVNIVLSERYG